MATVDTNKDEKLLSKDESDDEEELNEDNEGEEEEEDEEDEVELKNEPEKAEKTEANKSLKKSRTVEHPTEYWIDTIYVMGTGFACLAFFTITVTNVVRGFSGKILSVSPGGSCSLLAENLRWMVITAYAYLAMFGWLLLGPIAFKYSLSRVKSIATFYAIICTIEYFVFSINWGTSAACLSIPSLRAVFVIQLVIFWGATIGMVARHLMHLREKRDSEKFKQDVQKLAAVDAEEDDEEEEEEEEEEEVEEKEEAEDAKAENTVHGKPMDEDKDENESKDIKEDKENKDGEYGTSSGELDSIEKKEDENASKETNAVVDGSSNDAAEKETAEKPKVEDPDTTVKVEKT